MKSKQYQIPLEQAYKLANDFFETIDSTPVGSMKSHEELLALWDQELSITGMDPEQIIIEMDKSARPGLHLNQSGRFFSWVIGGSHPSGVAADWLTSAWDQNAGMFTVAPAASIAEEIAGRWLKKILKLPHDASFAFVTGCQMAHFTCLSAARNHLFHEAGWDIEAKGFFGAPRIRVICGDQKHSTINRAMRMLGFGTDILTDIPSDEHGRINVVAFEKELMKEPDVPTLVLLQAGDLNTGVYDDFKTIIPLAHKINAWVHVDGAFGLWASASDSLSHFTEGVEAADSWATDGHKWLNVPYDCGYAFTAHPEAHYRSMSQQASYVFGDQTARDPMYWNPEFSRRARGFATYAVIKELGTRGIEELIDRTCRHAHSIVKQAGQLPNTEVISIPIINQGLIRFLDPNSTNEKDHAAFTEKIILAINETGEAFFQPVTFKGKRCMRVSVSGWRTNDEDVRRTVEAIRLVLVSSVVS
ncbi:MAG TPA: aminotransferase class V-fold PLP-dependent enzyme [Saprospiraceae bacterium]|nr:aminotransferase class V-fold PLP-dependent enzyme [Saprospiraceae bacterium]